MKVALRQRDKNGKTSLYLDYYQKGKRKLEYLGMYLKPKPRTPEERELNNKTLKLAESIRAKRQIEIQNGTYGFADLEKMNSNFITYFEILADKRQESDGNYGNWLSALKHLRNFPRANVKFSEIDKKWLEDFKEYLVHDAKTSGKRNLSQNSCVSYFNKVRAALKQAVKDGIIMRNPTEDVESIKEAETKREFLTYEELQAAAKAMCENQTLKRAFLFSALTGLRFSDIEKLTWGEVQHSNETGYYLRFKQKKTKGQETLPIPDDVESLIGVRRGNEEKVFQDLTYSDYNNHLIKEWMLRAGIDRHITFHCARHTFATLQLTLGTDIYTVSKMLGHKELKTTEVYAKVIDLKKKEAANRIKLNL
ncbi:MAG: recombinase [Bacteroidetes bacterium HGW-Bacteroidetes-17]|jgi:integrase|nr:MAG: recombinase [Bacteroidetes bacterium HGW-Bacteroidetes-17]